MQEVRLESLQATKVNRRRVIFATAAFVACLSVAEASTIVTNTRAEVSFMASLWETDSVQISGLTDAQYPQVGTNNWQYIFPFSYIIGDGDIHVQTAVDSSGTGTTINGGFSPNIGEIINATGAQLSHIDSLNATRAIPRGIFRWWGEHAGEVHFEVHPMTQLLTWNGSAFGLDTDYHSNIDFDNNGTTYYACSLQDLFDGTQTMTAQVLANNTNVVFTYPSPLVNYPFYDGVALSGVLTDSVSSYFLFRPSLAPSATVRCRLVTNTAAAVTATGLSSNQVVYVNALTRTDMLAVSNKVAALSANQSATFGVPVELITLSVRDVSYYGCIHQIATSSSGGGSVSGTSWYGCGSGVTICATPDSCHTFSNWTESGYLVTTSACYSLTADASHCFRANFTPFTYSVSTGSSPPSGGTTSGGGTLNCGSSFTVCAFPASCYAFVNWTDNGNVVGTSACSTFGVNTNRTLVANFALTNATYTISTSSSPPDGGTTSGGGTSLNCWSNVTVSVCASPASCYSFVNWTENSNVVSSLACYTFTASAGRSLVANFMPAASNVIINTSSSPPDGGTTSGSGTVNCLSNVTVCATPNSYYTFVNWTENGNTVSSSSCYTFTVNAGRSLVANFTQTFQDWQLRYFGCTNCPEANPNADFDGDGMSNANEFLAGTDPTNTASAFRITAVSREGNNYRITWQTVGGRTNVVQGAIGTFDTFGNPISPSYTNDYFDITESFVIPGGGTAATNWLDDGAWLDVFTNCPARYYRIRTQP